MNPLRKLTTPLIAALMSTITLGFAAPAVAQAQLSLQVYNADAGSFHVNAVLVSGAREALLIDTGFTRSDAMRIAAMVLDSRKTLRTIYISQADPDYYFGTAVLKQFFPQAQLVATPATIDKMRKTVDAKLKTWGPRLGSNAPDGVPLPEPVKGTALELEGQSLAIRGLEEPLAHRSYLWIPSLRTIAGGVNVFSGVHVWTADTQTPAERAAWIRRLDAMAALQPLRVVPGHTLPGSVEDASQIGWTREYLQRFERELPQAADSAALIAAMRAAYPDAGLAVALEIGAKVAKGEMRW